MLIHPGRRVPAMRLNMTPMIDCVFLLLTFFMVVSELSRQYDPVEVRLPRASATTVPPPTATFVKLTAAGEIYFAGERVSLEALKDSLRWLRYNDPDASVVLQADERAEFRHVRAILKACADRRVRVWRLAFGARAPDESPNAQEEPQ